MIKNTFRGNRSRVFLALIALSSLPAGWWLREALSSRTEPASADIVGCEAVVATFDAYPLVYLGESFEGLSLNYCRRRQDPGIPGVDSPNDTFAFVYGTCTTEPDRNSCNFPLQVIVYARCTPVEVSNPSGLVVRGAPVGVTGPGGGDLLMTTAQFSVKIHASGPLATRQLLARRAFAQLRGANALALGLTVDKPLADPAAVLVPSPDKDACADDTTLAVTADPTPTPLPGPPYTILVDAVADGVVGAVQTSATVPTGGTRMIEVEALAVPNGLGGYSVVLGWDPAKLSVTAANIIDKTGFTQVAKSVNAAAGTLTVGFYNGADITCTNPAAGGAAEGAASAVLFEVTFIGVAAGLSSLTFDPVLTEIGLCDGAGGVSAPAIMQPAELTVSP